jgi:nucleoside-diphosphate-sugar epimerase
LYKSCFMTKKVIILGGAGYLGLSLTRYLTDRHEYDVSIGDTAQPSIAGVEFIPLNILDAGSLVEILKDFDYVINCAGQITYPINLCFQLNSVGINNIIGATQSFKTRIIQISTTSIYGSVDNACEDTAINPESPYSSCKAFAEFYIMSHLMADRYCILRISNLYGGGQPKGLFAYLLRSFTSDRFLEFNNDGTLLRYFIHIDDCIKAIELALNKDIHGIFNVSSGDRYSVKEIINQIEICSGITFKKQFKPVKPVENINMLDYSKFSTLTGFEPSYNVSSYIKEKFGHGRRN